MENALLEVAELVRSGAANSVNAGSSPVLESKLLASDITEAFPDPVVVADGLGVDSWAMLLGWHAKGLKRPDAILFADTGDEKPETYKMIAVYNAWLASVGYPEITVLKKKSPKTGDTSLSGECLRKSVLPSLAYGGHSCSLKWKVEPQWAYCRDRYGWKRPRKKKGELEAPAGSWKHGPRIIKLIGYDAGPKDAKRIKNAIGKWPPGHQYLYPLAEWGWDRAKCIEVIKAAGLPGWDPAFLADDLVTFSKFSWIEKGGIPCKSSCFMCPASQDAEILELARNHPKLMERALVMELKFFAKPRKCPDCSGAGAGCTRCAGTGELAKTVKGLGRSHSWKEIVEAPRAGCSGGCDNCDGVAFPMPKAA